MVVLRGQLKPFPFLECLCPGGIVTCRDSLPSDKNSSINLILLVPFKTAAFFEALYTAKYV